MKLFLPAITGRYAVGVTTFVTPVHPPRDIGTAKIKEKGKEPRPALRLEEVAYTAYYPADVSSEEAKARKGVDWFIRPIRESLEGFSTFLGFPTWFLWPIVYLFGSLVKIPAYSNVPLLHPRNIETKPGEKSPSKWPLVIFSHGLGGSRTAYSQICSRLAASGRVVLAVEHRDGTGTVSMPRSWHIDGNRSKPRTQLYLRENDIHWDDSDAMQPRAKFALRAEQLAFRHHEMYITYNTFCKLLHKDPEVQLQTIDDGPFDRDSWGLDSATNQALVECDSNVVLAGHSFGGCTVLSILSTTPPEEYKAIPIERALILDPWLEPLPTPGPVPSGFSRPQTLTNGSAQADKAEESAALVKDILQDENAIQRGETGPETVHPRMLVINSEAFTIWKHHFARVEEVVKQWEPDGKGILTVVGSRHTSFSDFPILPVISGRAAHNIFDTIANLSIAFLDRRLPEELEKTKTVEMNFKILGVRKSDGALKRKLVGDSGDVVVGGIKAES